VEQVSFKNDTGVYAVTLPETSKFDPAALKKAVGSFKLERVDLKIAGEVSKDDKGVWLTAPSGTKLLLANRPKKDDKDAPPDILAKIEEGPESRQDHVLRRGLGEGGEGLHDRAARFGGGGGEGEEGRALSRIRNQASGIKGRQRPPDSGPDS